MADGPLSQSPRQRDAQHGPSRPFGDTPFTSKLRTCLETQAGKSLNFEELAPRAGRDKHLRAELSNLAEDGLAVREHPLEHTRTLWPTGCRFASTARLATREPTAEGRLRTPGAGDGETHWDVLAVVAVLIVDDVAIRLPERLARPDDTGRLTF